VTTDGATVTGEDHAPGTEPELSAITAKFRAEPDDLARAKAVRDHAFRLGRDGAGALTVAEHRDAIVTAKLTTGSKFNEAHRAGKAARKAAEQAPPSAPAAERRPTPALADLTDDGNADLLVTGYGDRLRRVSDMGAWWWWTGQRWERDHDDAHVREAVKELARALPQDTDAEATHKRASMSSAGLTAAIRVAQSDPRVRLLARDMDRHPELLNTPNGVLNLRAGTLAAHNPALMLTRITAHPVDLTGPHPRWDAFLAETFGENEATPDKDRLSHYVQRLCGLALLGDVRDHVLPFLYGSGANGKGVLLLVLQGLLGSADTGGYAVSAPDGFLMTSTGSAHPTEIARLRGARLVVCSEQTSGKRFDEAKVKRLTGGDVLTGRFMRGDFFDFPPSHLIIVASNHLPAVREGGPSFWRRVRLVPFAHVVPPERRNPELHTELLTAEGPAILGWMARGAADVIRNGLQDPPRVVAATDDYRVSEDTLASFVRDECLLGANHWAVVSDFGSRYRAHCADMGTSPDDIPSAKATGMRLMQEYAVKPDRLSRPARRIYRGIGLLAPDDGGDDG
jgi:putative DNA primase/helicase